MESANAIFQTVLDYAQTGFEQVNAVLGLIIAIVAAFIMPSYGRVVIVSIGAVLVHEIVVTLLPVINGGGTLKLPEVLQGYFWNQVLFLFIGYLIIITIFYILRRVLLKR